MSTFYDPAKIRELAASGDPFWKGAAWILDQQDAAVAAAPTEDERRRSIRDEPTARDEWDGYTLCGR